MAHLKWSTRHGAVLCALAVLLAIRASAAEEEKPRLAVLNWEARGASAGEAEGVAEEIRSGFTRSGQFMVVDRTLTAKILEEWERQQSGLNEPEKALQVGKLYNVRYIVTGKLIRFESGGWLVSAVLLDAQTGVTTRAETLTHQGEFFPLLAQLPGIAARLAGAASPRPAPAAVRPPTASAPVTWQRAFGGAEEDSFSAALALPDGGFLLAGWTESQGSGEWDGWVLRLDGQGNPLWQRAFGGANWDQFEAALALPDGGFLLAGRTEPKGKWLREGWVLRLDGAGNPLWQRVFGGSARVEFNAVVAAPAGGWLLAGATASEGSGQWDGWVMRLDGEGRLNP